MSTMADNTEESVPDEGNTVMRTDSFKTSSVLHLADILSQNFILHPFVALRRTCQVNRKCAPYICVQPFSLLPFLYHQQRIQGVSGWYKGLTSELLVKGINLGAETAIVNYTDWPREVNSRRFFKDSLKVLTLRALTVAITTPFLCSAVKETIQSVIVVRDKPSFVDCLKDGFLRLIHIRSIPSARMLPIWLLIVPTVLYHVSHKVIHQLTVKGLESIGSTQLFNFSHKQRGRPLSRTHRTKVSRSNIDDTVWRQDELTYDSSEISFNNNQIETDKLRIWNSILALFAADVALLPIETVLNSLYIQGTRTIIDNVDETTVVLPVLTNYDGFADCYNHILKFEGNTGLYKGLGAIILQYSFHIMIFRLVYHLSNEFGLHQRATSPPRTKRPVRPTQRDYMQYIGNNRHSTPNNPGEFDPNLDYNISTSSTMNIDRDPWISDRSLHI